MINASFQIFIAGWLFIANPVVTGDKDFDISIRDLEIITALALFDYYFEIYNRISDLDGVNNF